MVEIVSQNTKHNPESQITAITMVGEGADADPESSVSFTGADADRESTVSFVVPLNDATRQKLDVEDGDDIGEKEDDGGEDELPPPSPVRQRPMAITSSTRSRRVSVYADVAYIPEARIRVYSPPRQRQKWGSDYVLPHVNWGDLFFDLFYVAGFYNLGLLLVDDPSPVGVLYFCGCFFPLMGLWRDKMLYDSLFVYGDDILHKIFEIAVLVVLATAVAYIAPVGRMSNPSMHIDTFSFALGISLGNILNCFRYLECYFYGRGQRRNIRSSSVRSIMNQMITLSCSVAATIIAGIAFFGDNDDDDGYARRILGAAEAADDPAACGDKTTVTHLPIVLLLVGWLLESLNLIVRVVFCFPNNGDHKKV